MFWIREHFSKMSIFNTFEIHTVTIENTIKTNLAFYIETCISLYEAMYQQDYKAYREEYLNYLETKVEK